MRLNSSVLTKVVEQEPKQFWMIGAGAEPKTFEWWGQNRNLKLGFWLHSPSLWGERVVHIIKCFSVFNGRNHLVPEPKT